MAASIALLTENNSETDATSHATASVTLEPNRLYLISFVVGLTSPSAENGAPSGVSSTGATWVQVGTIANAAPTATRHHLSVYRTMVSSQQTGAITMTHSGTVSNCAWRVVEYSGVVTSGTHGSGAVVQAKTATGSGTTRTVTMDSSLTAGNGTFAAMNHNSTSQTYTPGTDFTLIGDENTTDPGTPSLGMANEYDLIATDNVCDATSGNLSWTIIGVEITAATTHTAAATADGTGDLTAVATRTAVVAATMDGTGDLTATAVWTANAIATMDGTGALLAAALQEHNTAAATMDGTGALQAVAHFIFDVIATMDGAGDLTAVATRVHNPSALLTGDGDLAASAVRTAMAAALMTGQGDLTADAFFAAILTNTIKDPTGTAVPNVKVTVKVKPAGAEPDSGIVGNTEVLTYSDANGFWSAELIGNDRIDHEGSTYIVTQRMPNGTESTWKVELVNGATQTVAESLA